MNFPSHAAIVDVCILAVRSLPERFKENMSALSVVSDLCLIIICYETFIHNL